MHFLRLFSKRLGGRSTAELSFPTQEARGGRGAAPKPSCSPARPRQRAALVQVLSHSALALLLSDLGLACSRGKQGFTRPGELCRKHNTFPAPRRGKLPGREQLHPAAPQHVIWPGVPLAAGLLHMIPFPPPCTPS